MADTPDLTDIRMEVLDDIDERRFKQDEKWGPLPRRHPLDTWGMILGEEYGEFCEAALNKNWAEVYEELLDVAAVAVSIMEELKITKTV